MVVGMGFDPLKWCALGVRSLRPYEPGKPIEELKRELGLEGIVKLASNENPLGPSPQVIKALENAVGGVSRYPDGGGYDLKAALSRHHSIAPESILLGSGSDHLLELIARGFLQPGANAVMSAYSFAVYSIVSVAAGAQVKVVPALTQTHPLQPFGHDLTAMSKAIDRDTRVVFIANPNNPTGTWLSDEELRSFLDTVPSHVLVALDEAYYEYVAPYEERYPNGRKLLKQYENLVVLRTFSKAYGLAGLRVGCALASPALVSVLNRLRLSFNPNALAQIGACAALSDQDHVRQSVELNHSEKLRLTRRLEALDRPYIPSVCNFVTVNVGSSGRDLYQRLLQYGVITRPLDAYGLENHLRISVGLPEENDRLFFALKDLAGRKGSHA